MLCLLEDILTDREDLLIAAGAHGEVIDGRVAFQTDTEDEFTAQREVITLAFHGQLTQTEIAEQLGLPPGTVKGRMRLGLHKLRDEIGRSGLH